MMARPSFRQRRPAHEIHLAADAGIEPAANGVGHDLAGEVDLDRRS